MDLHPYMEELKQEVHEYLSFLKKGMYHVHEGQTENTVLNAMFYSLENGGKRLRPVLLLMVLDAFGIAREKGIEVACALEMIHTYSLIHDDLPAMDDDDLRRGVPTNHKVYGEAVAILAGDGLLTDAFEIMGHAKYLAADTKLQLVKMLASAAGSDGMIKGQNLDMAAEGKSITLDELKQIHYAKTGRLIEFACCAAGFIADVSEMVLHQLQLFSRHLGLAFQIQDDILDVCGDELLMGKTVGSDVVNGKSTYVSLLGLDGAKQMLDEQTQMALVCLDDLSADVGMLKALTLYVANREL